MLYRFIACVGLAVLIAGCAGQSANARKPKGGTISGRVTHIATGKPVEGVRVGISKLQPVPDEKGSLIVPAGDPPSAWERVSQKDGTFVIKGVTTGDWLLSVRDENYTRAGENVALTADGKRKIRDLNVTVHEPGRVSGRVFTHPFEKLLGGLKVRLTTPAPGPGPLQPKYFPEWPIIAAATLAFEAQTDSEGRFSIGGLPGGTYTIGPTPGQGYLKGSSAFQGENIIDRDGFTLGPGQHLQDVEFDVTPLGEIRGIVTDQAGTPVAGANINLSPSNKTQSDANGHFVFSDLVSIYQVTLHASSDNGKLVSSDMTVVPQRAPAPETRIVLVPVGSISGRIVASDGSPFAPKSKVQLNLRTKVFNDPDFQHAEADAAGGFSFEGVRPGQYSIDGYSLEQTSVNLPKIEVTLDAGQHLTGITITMPAKEGESRSPVSAPSKEESARKPL